MTLDTFDTFCASLPGTTTVVQWHNAHVWKVGGKIFALANDQADEIRVTFKAGDVSYELLKTQPGLRPAPYLASRGLKWIQHHDSSGLSDAELRDYIRRSHFLVAQGLSKKRRIALGLLD